MPIRTIGIISKPKKAEIRQVVTPLISWLEKHNVKVLIDRETSSMLDISDQGVSRNELPSQVDMILVLGGDGTLRAVAGALAGSQTALAALAGGTTNVWVRETNIFKYGY